MKKILFSILLILLAAGTLFGQDLWVDGIAQISGSSIQSDGTNIGIGKAPVSGSLLNLPLQDDATTPTLSYGDGDSGIYESADDNVIIATAATARWQVTPAGDMQSLTSAGAQLRFSGSSSIAPAHTFVNDGNTGVGRYGADAVSIIAGGVEAIRSAEATTVTTTFAGVTVGSHDDITATDAGVAASIATETTFVTTNGDSDLDNVTLADGVEGQVKYIACVVEGNAGDTWKVTPANMVGGTQITFAGIGEGCILKFYSTVGWVVVGNNGGTIS